MPPCSIRLNLIRGEACNKARKMGSNWKFVDPSSTRHHSQAVQVCSNTDTAASASHVGLVFQSGVTMLILASFWTEGARLRKTCGQSVAGDVNRTAEHVG